MSIKTTIISNTEVIEDTETGITHFRPIEEKKEDQIQEEKNLTWLGKVAKWFSGSWIKPYIKLRDFNNGPDTDHQNQCKPGVEVGVKIDF